MKSPAIQADRLGAFFREQARFAPGQDRCIASFYSALALLRQEEPLVQTFFTELMSKRPHPLPYLSNLLFHAVQYLASLFHSAILGTLILPVECPEFADQVRAASQVMERG